MKRCSNCLVPKPLSDFNKLTSSQDGHQNYCRTCMKAYQNDLRLGLLDCTKCGRSKRRAEFPDSRLNERGKFEWCFDCCKTNPVRNTITYHYQQYFYCGREYRHLNGVEHEISHL